MNIVGTLTEASIICHHILNNKDNISHFQELTTKAVQLLSKGAQNIGIVLLAAEGL